MLTILLHSSKTMRSAEPSVATYQSPTFMTEASLIADYLKTLLATDIQSLMKLSSTKAEQTHQLLRAWTKEPELQRPAIDAFLGDIYSGLQAQTFSQADREYANDYLLILSGLYGALRALDSVFPYRLEMGYKLPSSQYQNLPQFWGPRIASIIASNSVVINLSAVEYTNAVLPYIQNTVITPKFLTVSPKTGQPVFVTVHAKVARGAFARWLIQHQISSPADLHQFTDLNYRYDFERSTDNQPVFVCQKFGGIGLSVRLT